MAVVALGITLILMLFGILVQQNVIDTFNSVRRMNNYYAAEDLTMAALEMLQYEVTRHDVGYNTLNLGANSNEIICEFPVAAGTTQHEFCDNFSNLIVTDKPTKIWIKIKSRPMASSSSIDETLATDECRLGSACYVVPTPGTGSAGNADLSNSAYCDLYTPNYGSVKDVPFAVVGVDGIDQLDYSCNWDKLAHGSGLTDRVTIPLYYEGPDGIVNPFVGGTLARKFQLRMRTPCLPCAEDGTAIPGVSRTCTEGWDPTVCTNSNDRYKLNEDVDDIIVQWQLTGLCDGEECGVMGVPDPLFKKSAIYESKIYPNSNRIDTLNDADSWGKKNNIDSYESNERTILTKILQGISGETPMEKPVLTLFLTKPLISDADKNIPYLEYQLLTDHPVPDSKIIIEAEASVDGNRFKRTLYKEVQKELVDFAVQN